MFTPWFQPRIRNPHVTIYWLENPKNQWELCLLHWGGHTFHCRLQNHCDMFQGVGHIEGTMLMSAAPLVGIRLWTIFFATCFLSKNLNMSFKMSKVENPSLQKRTFSIIYFAILCLYSSNLLSKLHGIKKNHYTFAASLPQTLLKFILIFSSISFNTTQSLALPPFKTFCLA